MVAVDLEHRVLVQLDIHEDPTGGSLRSKKHPWRFNIVDGETKPRGRRERISRPVDRSRRRDQDEDDDRRRGGGGDRDRRGRDTGRSRSSGGKGERIQRSFSRAPRQDARDDRQEVRGDRDGGRRRRPEGDMSPLPPRRRVCSRARARPALPWPTIGSPSPSPEPWRQMRVAATRRGSVPRGMLVVAPGRPSLHRPPPCFACLGPPCATTLQEG